MSAIAQILSSIGGISPIGLVAHTGATGSANSGVTTGIDTTGATLLVVGVSYADTTGDVVVTDSKSNSWTAGTKHVTTHVANQLFWTTSAPSVGSAHTFTETLTAGTASITIAAFRNAFIGAVDGQNGANSAGISVTTIQTGTLTPSAPSSLLVASVAYFGGSAATIDSGFTVTDCPTSGSVFGCGLAYLIQTAAAAVNPTWTIPSYLAAASIAAFKHS